MEFAQTTAVPQLYAATGIGDGPPGTLLYLLPRNAPSTPPAISFADSWSPFNGIYIFLAQPLPAEDEALFAEAAWRFFSDPREASTRFAWLDVPPSFVLSGITLGVIPSLGGTFITRTNVLFPLRNVSLLLPRGAAITPDTAAFSFAFAQSGGWLGNGEAQLTTIGPAITLPFTGKLLGCLLFSAAFALPDLDDFGVALRYFYANPNEPPQPVFLLSSLAWPIFNEGLTLYASLDPFDPLDASRTFFAFNAADAGQPSNGAAPTVLTYYASTMGFAASLLPLTGTSTPPAPARFAALVFAPNQQASVPVPTDPLYLVPAGDFQILLASGQTGDVDFMCGLSGVESIGLAEEPAANILSFVPGQAAFAAGFIPGQPPPSGTAPQPALGDMPTTSFATLSCPSQALDYFAQPDASVLFNGGTNIVVPPSLQAVFPLSIAAATIPQTPPATLVFPLMPYGGLSNKALSMFSQMESQIVSPLRRSTLGVVPPLSLPRGFVPGTSTPHSTTPQGLLAEVESATSWKEIVLGQMQNGTQQLKLTGVTGPLLSAFQTNQMFVVASDPAAFESFFAPPFTKIIIGNQPAWTFDATPSNWSTYGTIVILKFCNQPIQDLAANVAAWSSADLFNGGDPGSVSTTIGNVIQEAIDSFTNGDGDMATFVQAVTNPSWNGVLLLNVASPLDAVPAQLAGLAANIPADQFFAHHVGVTGSKINVPTEPGGDITISDSSVFALIRYKAPPPDPSEDPYAFSVELLKVLFLNSAVASFASTIGLQINVLFNETSTLAGSTNNTIQFFGVYQTHVANGQTEDSYSFQTGAGVTAVFNMTSSVLNAVVLSRGQFFTVGESGGVTTSRFAFWGLLDFQDLTGPAGNGFDLFSFGRATPSSAPAGLSFGNLVLEMQNGPSLVPNPTFTFDATNLALDAASSTARSGSFYAHFPLMLADFTVGALSTTPPGLGFMSVQSPLAQSDIGFPWYSLDFTLNLGGSGALAPASGLVATLTAAWAPTSGTAPEVFIGLRLPGSIGSSRSIPIEGLFQFTFKTLQLVAIPTQSTFNLVLYDIGFELLSFTFPPTGQVNFVLFGDPDATSGNTQLGWYAAYAKPASQSALSGSNQSLLLPRPSGHFGPKRISE